MQNEEQPQAPSKGSTVAEILAARAAKPAREPHEIEHEKKLELLRKVRVVRETLLARNNLLENTNPAKQYCWVNTREERQMYYQAIGWVRCIDPNIKSPFRRPDGTFQRADVILYEIDKDYYEAIAADSQLRGLEGIDGAKTGFIDSINRRGVPEYIPSTR